MLTPSNVTVADFNAAVKNDAPSHIRITFTGQNIVLEDEDIEMSGMSLSTILNSDIDLTFGKAIMSSLTVNIINSSKLTNINWNGEFKLEIGVEVDGSTEYITLGYFTGSRPEKVTNVDVITFTANDRMQKFDILADGWLKSLTYPKTVAQMYASLCTYVGVSSESGDELANIMSRSFAVAPIVNTGLLCRDVLSAIAEACGCYAKIAANGKVKMVWFKDQTSYVLTGNDEFSADGFDVPLSGIDAITGIDGVSVKQTEDDIGVVVPNGATGNIYMIIDNPLLMTENASEVTNYITPLYNRLDALGGYLPCSVQCIGNPLVEAGDIITAYVNGQSVRMPIFVKNLQWNGSCADSYEATGNMKREAVKISDRQKLTQGGRYHIFKNDIETLQSEMGDAQGNISQLQQDVGGLSTRVQSAEGNISSVQQQANRIDATVSQKTRVFYGSTTPTGTTADPVISGDLWVDTAHNNALKRYNGSSWVDASYDDPDIATISLAVQKKARVYYSNTAPSGSTSDPLVTGDLWIDTAHNNQLKRYNGSSWVDASFDDPDKYTVYSGIDITSNGIDITGSKYVKIRSGGTFDVDSTNFKISSTDAEIQFGNQTDGRWQINRNGLFFAKEGPISGSHLSNTIRVSAANSFEFYFGEDVFGDFYTYIMGSGKFYGYNSYASAEPEGPDLGSTTYPWETLYVKKITGDAVVDNLTSTATDKVLSAKQGKVLNDGKANTNGSNASGTWGINVTGSAGSVAWGNVTGKPNRAGSPSDGGDANSARAVRTYGLDVTLGTSGTSSDDSGDIVFLYGNGQEKARLWTDNAYTSESGLSFRMFKADGTQLFTGTIPLRNTWRPVVDNLTSTDTDKSLSAKQGKVLNDAKVSKSGDTMTGQLKTSFKTSVAMGSYAPAANTVQALVEEVRYSSGCAGSVNISTAYSDIPAGWYNFVYMPHRSGGVNGAASGDNQNYGNLLLCGMTVASNAHLIRVSSGAIAEVSRNLYADNNTWRGFQTKQYSYSWSGSCTNGSVVNVTAANFGKTAISGYTPVGIVQIHNASGFVCNDIDITVNSGNVARFRNVSGSTITSGNFEITVLYLQN